MNIQSLLMDSNNDRDSISDSKFSIKSEDRESPIKNRILSPQSLMFSKENPRFWSSVSTSSFSTHHNNNNNNIFLPPTRPLTTSESNSNNNNNNNNNSSENPNSHALSSFVDLSSDQNMICPLCKKIFRFEKNLLRHMQKTHATGEAESVLKCKLCNYTTRHYSNMYVHIRTHTGDKPYSCSGCGASFTQGSSLKLHIKSRHEDNTGLFSLTKKPGKNNLTKLWTRVYKKDLSKFSNYGLGNYFSPFNVPNINNHPPHDLLLPFTNFLSYPRLPQLPYISNCSSQFSNISHNPHHLPMFLSRLPFLPSHFRQENLENPEPITTITNINQIDKTVTNHSPPFRNKKSILSISDFVNDDKPLSRLPVDEGDDFKSSEEDEISMKYKEKVQQFSKSEITEKDEENNSEILSVMDFEVEEASEKINLLNEPFNDFIKTILCNQSPQNIDQLFQIVQSMGPSFFHKLKSFFPNKTQNSNDNTYFQHKLPPASMVNGYASHPHQHLESKPKYSNNNGLLPPCISRNNNNNNNLNNNNNNNNNIFPFSIRPSFHNLLNNQTAGQTDLSSPWTELFTKISQLSDKSMFHQHHHNHNHPSQTSNTQSIRSAMMPPSNMFGMVGYQPLMKMLDKTSNQFLQ